MTRKEHLQKLPLQKRLQAMENIRLQNNMNGFPETMNEEIDSWFTLVFVFENTRQGHGYWWNVYEKYYKRYF